MPKEVLETLAEMRRRLKTARDRDVHDRHIGLQQQLARARKAELQIIAGGAAIEMLLEKPLEVPPRQSDPCCHHVEAQGLFDIGFHERGGIDDLLLFGADPRKERYPLLVLGATDALQDEFLGDLDRKLLAHA